MLFLPALWRKFLPFSRYVGRLFVKSSGKPIEILTKLNEMAGFAPDEEIELYEVLFLSSFWIICAFIILIWLFYALCVVTLVKHIWLVVIHGLGNKIWALCHVWTPR